MGRLCVAGLLLLPTAAAADGVAGDCARATYSYAEVMPPGAREPLIAVPHTLCADLAASGSARIDSLNIYLDGRAQPRPADRPPRPHVSPHRGY